MDLTEGKRTGVELTVVVTLIPSGLTLLLLQPQATPSLSSDNVTNAHRYRGHFVSISSGIVSFSESKMMRRDRHRGEEYNSSSSFRCTFTLFVINFRLGARWNPRGRKPLYSSSNLSPVPSLHPPFTFPLWLWWDPGLSLGPEVWTDREEGDCSTVRRVLFHYDGIDRITPSSRSDLWCLTIGFRVRSYVQDKPGSSQHPKKKGQNTKDYEFVTL